MKRTVFQQLSNDISTASATEHKGQLRELSYDVLAALSAGHINVKEAAELQQDIIVGQDAIPSLEESTDFVRHVFTERPLENI